MNANNVPLNAEEQRNARYQGPFKWFIVSVAEAYKEILFKLDLLSRRDLIRMIDLRLYAELSLTLDSNFQTVKGEQLDRLYRKYNGTFDAADAFREKICYGVDFFLEHKDELHQDVFLRMHVFQSIVLAAIALEFGGTFDEDAKAALPNLAQSLDQSPINIETLAGSLREPEAFPQMVEFIKASTQATNTGHSRLVRFLHFRAALAELP